MKFIADENVPLLSVKKLRQIGLDIDYISELSPGISDREVLKIAAESNRIIITFDKDFGDLIFRDKVDFKIGIIYLKFVPSNPLEPASLIYSLLKHDNEIAEMFIVLEKDSVRKRKL